MDAASAFEPFPKIPRLNRNCVITEKIDGTNAAVLIVDGNLSGYPNAVAWAGDADLTLFAQSRKRFVTPGDDNFGFAAWVSRNYQALARILGPGRHYGEWWGQGIQRGYGLSEKRFSLFNPYRYELDLNPNLADVLVPGLDVVPVLYEGPFSTSMVHIYVEELREHGSRAAPGYFRPEGVIVWHEAARSMFKVTLENDEAPKGLAA